MRICNHCGGEVVEKTYTIGDGMDGCSVCLSCGIIEGGDHEEEDEEEDGQRIATNKRNDIPSSDPSPPLPVPS